MTNLTPTILKTASDIEAMRIKLKHLKEDLEFRIEQNTPIDGWPGKNAEARDAAKAAWVNADAGCSATRLDIRNLEIGIARAEGDLAAFDLERRDREWTIRQDLIGVLREHGATAALPF